LLPLLPTHTHPSMLAHSTHCARTHAHARTHTHARTCTHARTHARTHTHHTTTTTTHTLCAGSVAAFIRIDQNGTVHDERTVIEFAPFTALGVAISLFLGFRNNAAYDSAVIFPPWQPNTHSNQTKAVWVFGPTLARCTAVLGRMLHARDATVGISRCCWGSSPAYIEFSDIHLRYPPPFYRIVTIITKIMPQNCRMVGRAKAVGGAIDHSPKLCQVASVFESVGHRPGNVGPYDSGPQPCTARATAGAFYGVCQRHSAVGFFFDGFPGASRIVHTATVATLVDWATDTHPAHLILTNLFLSLLPHHCMATPLPLPAPTLRQASWMVGRDHGCSSLLHDAWFSTEMYTRGCHWFPSMFV
jgi:hypothetical protein